MMQSAKPGVVYDCMTYLQGVASPAGPAAACLQLAEAESVTLYVSEDVLLEIQEVLSRPKVRAKSGGRLTDERVQALLERLRTKAVLLDAVAQQFTYERDPKDERYVNLALAAGAKYLVTRDKDLLDLMDENTPAGEPLRAEFPQLIILNPVAFLEAVRDKPGPETPA